MTERQRKGSLNLDPAVAAWQKSAAENKAALTGQQKRDRARTRIYIDIDARLKDVIEKIAGIDLEDTSMSQAAEMLLAYGALAYIHKRQDLHDAFSNGKAPARTPRFAWNISLPVLWQRILDSFLGNGQVGGKVDG